jgi:hypothetical protein
MSSTPESIPLTRRSHGGLAVALGVLLAIAVAVALIAVTGSKTTVPPRPVGASQATVASPPHTPGARQQGEVINGGPTAANGNSASSPTVLPNANPQQLREHNLKSLRAEDLPGWLLR